MRIRSPKDFWAGLIFVAIGGGFVLLAQQYRLGDMHRMGPAMFPTLIGALLAALGLIIALRSFVLDGAPVPRFDARPIGISMLAIVLFGIALNGSAWSPPSRRSCWSEPTLHARCGWWTISRSRLS